MNNLKKIRENKGILQKEMADKLNLSERQYRRLEAGECNPDIQTAIRIADTLEVSDVRVIWGRQPLDTPV